jgi:hypothetical protein
MWQGIWTFFDLLKPLFISLMAGYLNNGDNPWAKYGITFYDFQAS